LFGADSVPSIASLLPILCDASLLAAGKRTYSSSSHRGRVSEPEVDVVGLLLVVGGLLALGLAAWGFTYWQKRREGRVLNSPRKLFRELCNAHGFTRADRDLLLAIAQWHEVEDPVLLFLEPQRFEDTEMQEELDCEAEAKELHERLFARDSAENEELVASA
jgi:hypothetical protein